MSEDSTTTENERVRNFALEVADTLEDEDYDAEEMLLLSALVCACVVLMLVDDDGAGAEELVDDIAINAKRFIRDTYQARAEH